MPYNGQTSQQVQLNLFDEPTPSVETLLSRPEDQWFDRKSFRIESQPLADRMVGFANADGGRFAIGISNGEIEGVDGNQKHLNSLIQAAIDHTAPPVRHAVVFLQCTDRKGRLNRLLLLDVEASEQIHRNRRGECFLRVGDENRRLGTTEECELAFDKGEAIYDSTVVPTLTRDDLDIASVEQYANRIGSADLAALLRSRGLYYDTGSRIGVTQAGLLLFGRTPPVWSYIRYLRHLGTTIESGTRSNLLEDVLIEGTIPSLIEQSKALLTDKLGAIIRQTAGGKFESVPTLPEFAWLEAIVNAVTHRSYSLQGDGVRVRDFEDRLEVESPGRLPSLVRVQNIRKSRFSRNPHIARVLAEMTGYVRELNEGVQRMFEEMQRHGLRPPEYRVGESSVRVILYKQPAEAGSAPGREVTPQLAVLQKRIGKRRLELLLSRLKLKQKMPPREIAELLAVSFPTARTYMRILESTGAVRYSARGATDPAGMWVTTDVPLWTDIHHALGLLE